MGADEHASLTSASRAEREQIEALLISFIRASRVPSGLRDRAVCNRLERALADAVEAQASRFRQEAAAAASSTPSGTAEQPASAALPVASAAAPPAAATPSASAAASAALPGASALLPRLLSQPGLLRSEAVCNANSCLLAGFETTALLLATSLLHLAEAPHLQAELRAALRPGAASASAAGAATAPSTLGGAGAAPVAAVGATAAPRAAAAAAPRPPLLGAILRETLRVNPPVSGLPRRVVAPEGICISLASGTSPGADGGGGGDKGKAGGDGGGGGGGSGGKGGKGCADCARARELTLPPGFAFSVDLVSAAHGWRRPGAHAGDDGAGDMAGDTAAVRGTAAGLGSQSGGGPRSHVTDAGLTAGLCCPALLFPRSDSPTPPYRTNSVANGNGTGGSGDHTPQFWDPTSWLWDPKRPPPPPGCPDRCAEAAPFGIGPRSCPAGSLSVVLVREVLAELAGRFGWRLAKPDTDRHWGSRTATVPTLAVRGPIPLRFQEAE